MELRDARKMAGLSQVILAKRAGIAQQDVSGIERGKVPTFAQVTALVTALRKAGLVGLTAGDINFATNDEQAVNA